MAYTEVPEQATGDQVTAAEFNTWIRDNFAASIPDIFTTKGDIAVASGADTADRVAVGDDAEILTANSGETTGVEWTHAQVARYQTDAEQAIPNITSTIIDFEDSIFDPDSSVTAGATWKFTTARAGYYQVSAGCTFSPTDWGGGETVRLSVNVDSAEIGQLDFWKCSANTDTGHNASAYGSTLVYAAASKDIDVRVYQGSGDALALTADGSYNWISIAEIR